MDETREPEIEPSTNGDYPMCHSGCPSFTFIEAYRIILCRRNGLDMTASKLCIPAVDALRRERDDLLRAWQCVRGAGRVALDGETWMPTPAGTPGGEALFQHAMRVAREGREGR